MSEQVSANVVETVPEPKTSGPTHQQSGPGGPDPTGLRGTLQKNFAKAAETAAAETNAAKAPKKEVTSSGPVRGPDGKFQATETKSANDLPAKPDETKPDATPEDPDAPPSSWRAEAKALWKEIDAKFGPDQAKVLKEELRKRENDFKNGILDYDRKLKAIQPVHDELQNLFKPFMDAWKAQGVTVPQAVNHLLQLQANFQRDPRGTIQWLAQTAKLNLADLGQTTQTQGQQGGNTDPQLNALLQKISGLEQQVTSLSSGFTQQTQSAAAAEIQAFMEEKGQDGQPLRPHFNDAFQHIQRLMPVIQAEHPGWTPRQIVNEAYDSAIWANSEIRGKLQAAEQAKSQAAADAQRRNEAAQLAARSATNGGSPNRLDSTPNANDLRGLLASKLNGTSARL